MSVVKSNYLGTVKTVASHLSGISNFNLLITKSKLLLATLSNVQVDYVKRFKNIAALFHVRKAHSLSGHHI